MHASRRRFLQSTLGSATLLSSGLTVPGFLARSARAAAGSGGKSNEKVLVVIQLSGGNDGLNTVIPYADDDYARNRIALRIPTSQVLKLNDHVGLHPRMNAFHELHNQGRLATVQGVGYSNPDRSHFRSMDIWHSAQRENEQPRDGWLGRCLDNSRRDALKAGAGQDVPALHLGANELPLALVSRATPVPSVESLESFRFRTENGAIPLNSLKSLAAADRSAGVTMLDFLRRSTLNAYASSEQVRDALAGERDVAAYPEQYGLARKLKNIAQLIDAGLATRIYYVSLAGFDTHANQQGTHANLLGELANSTAAFVKDLENRGHLDRVLVMSFSEFGRRVRENASEGTDHGAAAPMFLAGGMVKSGVLRKHPSLTDLDDGDLKHHTDFREVYATILDRWLGCASESVLGSKFEPLPILA